MKTFNNIHEAYLGVLEDVYFNYEYRAAARGLPAREKTDYSFRVLNPTNEPIVTKDEERNKVIVSYTQKETDLYNSCANTASEFGKASKFWEKLANPDGTVNSAYGYLIWENKSHGCHFERADVLHEAKWENDEAAFFLTNDVVMRTPWEWAKQCL